MVSSGVVALALAALVQVACSSYVPCCQTPQVRYEECCCPGPVIEKKYVVQRPVSHSYAYQVPVYSKNCYSKPAGVEKAVVPQTFESGPVCQTQETVIKVPTTDVEVLNQPLCKRTCTTSRYVIQVPITETTCTHSPLCKKTVRSQDNLLTTVSKKTSCAKQHCVQNTVVEKPVFETVCQDYQQSINKVATKTVLKPEVKKTCVQLPPYKCVKPVYESGPVCESAPAVSYGPGYGSYPGGVVSAPAVSYGSGYGSSYYDSAISAPVSHGYSYGAPAYSPASCYSPAPTSSCACSCV